MRNPWFCPPGTCARSVPPGLSYAWRPYKRVTLGFALQVPELELYLQALFTLLDVLGRWVISAKNEGMRLQQEASAMGVAAGKTSGGRSGVSALCEKTACV